MSGLGLVTPLGVGREETWAGLLAGRSGLSVEGGVLAGRVGALPTDADRSRTGELALSAAREAVLHAGLADPALLAGAGCVMGLSKPIVDGGDVRFALLAAPFFNASPADLVRHELGLDGPSATVSAACATGVVALHTAAAWIRDGLCDIVLAGAAESSLNAFYRAGFQQMGVLSPALGPDGIRPFDRRRDGFAMAEGAAVLVLESAASLARRGGRPVARVAGLSLTQAAADAVRFDSDGGAVERLVRRLVASAGGVRPDYVNAHGTGTTLNDRAEALGLARAFGSEGASVAVSSTKAATGHLLGAAGAVEAAVAALAARDGFAPATLNLEEPEFGGLGWVRGAPLVGVRRAASLSYGFGGQMAGVLFERAA